MCPLNRRRLGLGAAHPECGAAHLTQVALQLLTRCPWRRPRPPSSCLTVQLPSVEARAARLVKTVGYGSFAGLGVAVREGDGRIARELVGFLWATLYLDVETHEGHKAA